MQSKKFIICGVPRAWKSTLAHKIARQLWCSHIPLDPFMTTFHTLYPETGITLSMKCDTSEYFRICQHITQFLLTYLKALDKELESYVIEWFHMDMNMLIEHFWDTHTIVVVWYPHVSQEQKIRAIRRYDTSDIHWTYVLEKTELEKQIQWFIELSKLFYHQAEKLWVVFVDTSFDYEKVIEEYIGKLETNKFDVRNIEKQNIHYNTSNQNLLIHPRDIWYVKLWINIWYEQNGKRAFLRPVVVISKIWNMYFCIPLTTKWKNNQWYHKINSIPFGKPSSIILSQARTLDKSRFHTKLGKVSSVELSFIKQKIAKMYGYL